MKNSKIISEIRSVLVNDWDPIGIGGNLNLSDEYDSYIGSIMKSIMQKLSIEEIIELLKKIENEEMGIYNANAKHLNVIAHKLKDIGDLYSKDYKIQKQ